MIAVFDIQHSGQPGRPNDHGGQFDLDGNGVIEHAERESALAGLYVEAATLVLRSRDVEVRILDAGEYSQRHLKACEIARERHDQHVLYIPTHVNAGGGHYALTEYDYRSFNGLKLAGAIARAFDALPGIDGHKSWPMNETTRGWRCLRGVGEPGTPSNVYATLVEPYFIDQPDHAQLASLQGSKIVGEALAAGILVYQQENAIP